MSNRHEVLLQEVRTRVSLLKNSLPHEVDGFALSSQSKLPFKVLLYREALIWRMAELGECACRDFEADDLISGIVLTRAAVETAAALWFLHGKVDAAVKSRSVGDIDTYLMKLNFGTTTFGVDSQDDQSLPRPVKVSKFLESVEADIEGYSHSYGTLSDFAHPNWAGTTLTYSKIDRMTGTAVFGKNLRSGKTAKTPGLSSLMGALEVFEFRYNGIRDLLPAFVRLCEESKPQK